MKLVEGADAPACLLKVVARDEVEQPPDFAWSKFRVSKEGLVVQTGTQQDGGQFIGRAFNERLSFDDLGWEAPTGSVQAKASAERFIEYLKKCGCPPTSEHGLWCNLADFWFDASSETTRAYYRLSVSSASMYTWSVALLVLNVYWPTGKHDSAVMRNIRFLDGVLRSIAGICGAKKLTKR